MARLASFLGFSVAQVNNKWPWISSIFKSKMNVCGLPFVQLFWNDVKYLWNNVLKCSWSFVFSEFLFDSCSSSSCHFFCVGGGSQSEINLHNLLVFSRWFSIKGTPNVNFRKISVWKTMIWDLEFSEHFCKISCLPASPRIFKHLKNGIITHF